MLDRLVPFHAGGAFLYDAELGGWICLLQQSGEDIRGGGADFEDAPRLDDGSLDRIERREIAHPMRTKVVLRVFEMDAEIVTLEEMLNRWPGKDWRRHLALCRRKNRGRGGQRIVARDLGGFDCGRGALGGRRRRALRLCSAHVGQFLDDSGPRNVEVAVFLQTGRAHFPGESHITGQAIHGLGEKLRLTGRNEAFDAVRD